MVAGSTLRGSDRWQTRTDRTALRICRPSTRGTSTRAEARGRFFNTGNAFNVQLPPVPDRIFTTEPPSARSGDADRADPCDISAESGMRGFRPRRRWCWPTMRGSAPVRRWSRNSSPAA